MKDNNEKQDGQQSQTLLISKLPANAFALNYPWLIELTGPSHFAWLPKEKWKNKEGREKGM